MVGSMLDLLRAIALGLLQGFTEWLPISSSGHLVIAQRMMDFDVPVAFDVMLHVGTLIAVITSFRKDLAKILKSLICLDVKGEHFRLLLLVMVGSIPTAAIGLLFLRFFESLFSNMTATGVGFLITAALLFSSETRNGDRPVSWLNSLVMGLAQAASIAPGISRSGATISVGLLSGVERWHVFRFSFLLSIPAVAGALLMEYRSLNPMDLGVFSLVGMIVAAVSGYLAIQIVYRMLLSERLHLFAFYCLGAGLITLLVLR